MNDAIGLTELDAKPTELVEEALARIETLDGGINAVIHRRDERALAEAAAVDPTLPFAGVPFLAKDAGCAIAGEPYTVGIGKLRDVGHTATVDSELYLRFRRAGFVCVGRTNVPQLCLSATTEPTAFGPTRNPHDRDRSVGGSSGGSAAAVAAGMVPVAHGNDAGGSIRIPAALCGLVGLKPTRARTPEGPEVGLTWGGLNHEFVLTRSVRDTAALLDVLSGRAWGDPYCAPPPTGRWIDDVGRDPGRLRVRVTTSVERTETDAAVAAAVIGVARGLEGLGHHVEEGPLSELDEASPWGEIVAANVLRDLDRLSAASGVDLGPDDLEPLPAMIAGGAPAMSAVHYLAALDQMFAHGRRIESRWEDFDLLLTPTSAIETPRIGDAAPETDLAVMAPILSRLTVFTAPFDVTGQPAISLPLGTAADGMPIGVQLVAATGREDLLLQVASQLLPA